jgi:hypothetical protein
MSGAKLLQIVMYFDIPNSSHYTENPVGAAFGQAGCR